ncbi:hypothetical protein HUJ04_008512 [Dendroctonus ponderosae]|nr:hypothetical protein HUJ04_008512 [Dendroctonus ponderosae]
MPESLQAEKLPEAPPESRVPEGGLFCMRPLPETVQAFVLSEAAKLRYFCQCGKGYVHKSNLKRHEKEHEDELFHHCNLCAYKSSRSDSLRRHFALVHKTQIPMQCLPHNLQAKRRIESTYEIFLRQRSHNVLSSVHVPSSIQDKFQFAQTFASCSWNQNWTLIISTFLSFPVPIHPSSSCGLWPLTVDCFRKSSSQIRTNGVPCFIQNSRCIENWPEILSRLLREEAEQRNSQVSSEESGHLLPELSEIAPILSRRNPGLLVKAAQKRTNTANRDTTTRSTNAARKSPLSATNVNNSGNVKRFKCPNCFRAYKSKGNMQRHLNYECGKAPQFKCQFCFKAFSQKTSLNYHLRMLHGYVISSTAHPFDFA